MNKLLYINSLVEQDYFEFNSRIDGKPQVAGRKLESAYLEGFLANDVDLVSISFFPASTYPANKKIMFGFKRLDFAHWRLPFINFPSVKLVTRFLSCLFAVAIWCIITRRKGKICIYSLHTPYLLASAICKILFQVEYFVIVPDLPTMMHPGGGAVGYLLLKRIDNLIINFTLRFASGFSVVAKDIINKLPKKNSKKSIVIEGLSGARGKIFEGIKQKSAHDKPYFLYSGGLDEGYGVREIVEPFMRSNSKADLLICGTGSLVSYIKKSAAIDSRIKFLGFLAQNELRDFQESALALLLIRNPNDEFVKYSFPSKLIEYMNTGRPIICSRLPGIPDFYFDYLIPVDGVDELALMVLFSDLSRGLTDDQLKKAHAAPSFVRGQTNPKRRVLDFIKIMFPFN